MSKLIRLSDHFTYGKLLRFTLPSICMMVFTSIYGVVDGLFVSNFVGKTPFAAVNLVMPFVMILGGMGFMIGTGGTALVSKLLGEGKPDEAHRTFSMLVLFTLLLGAVLSAVGIITMPAVSRLLGASDAMIADCVLYGRIVTGFTFAFMLQNVFQSFFIAAEKPRLGLFVTVAAGITNMVLDALFIAVFNWGVAGAAIATSLSQLICAGLVIWVLLRIPGDCRLHVSELRFDSVLLRRMTAIGLPAGLATIMYSVANVIIQKAINLLGTDTAAAWSIYWKLDGFYWPVSNAIGITVMTFAGQNYGARQLDRITSVIRTGMWMHVGFSALFSALLFLTRGLTVRFFTDDTNVMAEGSRIITMLAFFYPTFCCVEVLSSAMRGCGRSVMPTVLTLFGTCLLRLALLFFVTFPHLNNWTIALCYPATWLTTSVLFVIYYKCFRWMPEIKQT